ELVLHPVAEEDHAPALELVAGIEPTAFKSILVAHLAVCGADAARRGVDHAIGIRDRQPLYRLQARLLHHVGFVADGLQIGQLKLDDLAGTLAARLFAGLSRPGDDRASAER